MAFTQRIFFFRKKHKYSTAVYRDFQNQILPNSNEESRNCSQNCMCYSTDFFFSKLIISKRHGVDIFYTEFTKSLTRYGK